MAKSRGLEKDGRRERILGLRRVPQYRGLRANAEFVGNFSALTQLAVKIWRGAIGRSEPVSTVQFQAGIAGDEPGRDMGEAADETAGGRPQAGTAQAPAPVTLNRLRASAR